MKRAHTLAIAAALLLGWSAPAAARNGPFHVAIIQVLYTDTGGGTYTRPALDAAAGELATFFSELSYGRLAPTVQVTTANMPQNTNYYWGSPGHDLRPDAVNAAIARGEIDFSTIDALVFVHPWCQNNWTGGPYAHTAVFNGVTTTRWFQHAHVFSCYLPAPLNYPGPSGIEWGPWAHEVGHELELSDGIALGGNWNGHPSGYSSGYDLMDSCYPGHASAYSLADAPTVGGARKVFPGWLPDAEVVRAVAPTLPGTTLTSASLLALSEPEPIGGATRAIKIPLDVDSHYYMVECRHRTYTDALNVGPGIWDEGVRISEVNELHDPPVVPIDSCDTNVAGGCVRSNADSRAAACNVYLARNVSSLPPYCWPYPLFHAGDDFRGPDLDVVVDNTDGNACHVSVYRSLPQILQPRFPPQPIPRGCFREQLGAWQDPHVWTDSSCNGYEAQVGAAGLRYGRGKDGTVTGSGDDLCLNHENRLYTTVRNVGTGTAKDVQVTFRVPATPGLQVSNTDNWVTVGVATSQAFPQLAALDPGKSVDVWVAWTPVAKLDDGQYAAGGFNAHTSIYVDSSASNLDPDPGRPSCPAQENAAAFDVVYDAKGQSYGPFHQGYVLVNDFKFEDGSNPPLRRFEGGASSLEDTSWLYALDVPFVDLPAGGSAAILMSAGVPASAPIGATQDFAMQTGTLVTLHNDAVGKLAAFSPDHNDFEESGVTVTAHAVAASSLWVAPSPGKTGSVVVSGQLAPAMAGQLVALDYSDGNGATTHLVVTEKAGAFTDTCSGKAGASGTVRALWQGNQWYAATGTLPAAYQYGQ